MVCAWFEHGLRMVYAWFTHGLRMVYAWLTHGLRMVYAWFTHGLRMVYAWFTQGLGMVYEKQLMFTHDTHKVKVRPCAEEREYDVIVAQGASVIVKQSKAR
jgi:hypothetical protein